MNKIWSIVALIIILLVFICYMVFDMAFKNDVAGLQTAETDFVQEMWEVSKVIDVAKWNLKAVAATDDGGIYLAGDSFISSYTADLSLKWEYDTEPITAIAAKNDRIYAISEKKVMIFDNSGKKITDWGAFASNSILTSVSANDTYIAIADAGTKLVYVLDLNGNMQYTIGKSGEKFIVPSPYFDLCFADDNTLFIANPGKFRIERRKIDGTLIDFFGEAGIAPSEFCGCCNPAHIAVKNQNIVTAEKGINRIKILNENGEFVEFVSSKNNFSPPIPLDIAVSSDGNMIYGAYSGSSKLYIFKRKPNAES
jgi:sugar lactone lactonase YvrE